MKQYTLFVALAVACLLEAPADGGQPLRIRLTDDSQLFVEATADSLPVTLDDLDADFRVPFGMIEQIHVIGDNKLRLHLTNSDRMTVRLPESPMEFTAIFGQVRIPLSQIREIGVVNAQKKPRSTPQTPQRESHTVGARPNQLDYANLCWELWRTDWKIIDDRFTAIGKIRPGYQYGHWASGRGAQVITGNGDPAWQDYEIAFDFHMEPATRDFYHAHIPGETRGMAVVFRSKSMTESWNDPDTGYLLGVNPDGSWGIGVYEDFACPGFGWNANFLGKQDRLVVGKTETPLSDATNHLRLRVVGSTFTLWINGEQVTEYVHREGGKVEPIPFGGFGVRWRFESLGWIGNVSVERL